jgi:hypothetical protein
MLRRRDGAGAFQTQHQRMRLGESTQCCFEGVDAVVCHEIIVGPRRRAALGSRFARLDELKRCEFPRRGVVGDLRQGPPPGERCHRHFERVSLQAEPSWRPIHQSRGHRAAERSRRRGIRGHATLQGTGQAMLPLQAAPAFEVKIRLSRAACPDAWLRTLECQRAQRCLCRRRLPLRGATGIRDRRPCTRW